MARRSLFLGIRLKAGLSLALAAAGFSLAGCGGLFSKTEGERVYSRLCSECHGVDARGNTPRYMGNPYADLTDSLWKTGGDPMDIERVVRGGIFGQMPAHPELTPAEMQALIDHVRVLRGEKRPER